MKILVVPDKFKGSLTSIEAASLIGEALINKGQEVETSALADGGEGTVDAILSTTGGRKKNVFVKDPLGRKIDSFFGITKDRTAIIEMAAASGLDLLSDNEHNPLKTTTYGTGQLVKEALNEKATKIIIGVGGSATNDGGMGAAVALGAKFLASNGVELDAIGENLGKVDVIDLLNIDKRLRNTEILVAVDVENPFYGRNGAAHIYAPQKGADAGQVKELDKGLKSFAEVVKHTFGKDLQNIKGAGAAGGLAGGLVAFLGAKITPGTDFICKLLNLEEKVNNADLVISGEGGVDEQTLFGKAPSGVIKLAKKAKKRMVIIAGQLGEGWEKIEQMGVKVYALSQNNEEAKRSIQNPKPAIEKAVEKILSDIVI